MEQCKLEYKIINDLTKDIKDSQNYTVDITVLSQEYTQQHVCNVIELAMIIVVLNKMNIYIIVGQWIKIAKNVDFVQINTFGI